MERAHEQLKLAGGADSVAWAIEALSADVNSKRKVYVAEKTHRRIANKLQKAEEAKRYYELAQQIYPYSTYFEGEKKDVK